MSDTRLILGDCLEILPTLAAGSVDAVVTDPPYGVTKHAWDVRFRQEWLDEFLRVSSGPVLAINAARTDIQKHMLSLNPLCDRVMAWRQPLVRPSGGMFWTWQPVYVWRDHFRGWDTLQVSCQGMDYQHPTQKPVALMKKLLDMATPPGATVLDPFMGSGTTGVACVQTGRNFIGIEICEEYFRIAQKRIAEAQMQPVLDGLL